MFCIKIILRGLQTVLKGQHNFGFFVSSYWFVIHTEMFSDKCIKLKSRTWINELYFHHWGHYCDTEHTYRILIALKINKTDVHISWMDTTEQTDFIFFLSFTTKFGPKTVSRGAIWWFSNINNSITFNLESDIKAPYMRGKKTHLQSMKITTAYKFTNTSTTVQVLWSANILKQPL